jgi:hypothetical protein
MPNRSGKKPHDVIRLWGATEQGFTLWRFAQIVPQKAITKLTPLADQGR